MSITDLNQNLVPIERLLDKKVNQLTFKESACLIFHAVETVSRDSQDLDAEVWNHIYQEFLRELTNQRANQWPQLEITRNDYAKRIDILNISKPFITSSNICTLLFRLLYIESYKRPYVLKSYGYHRILGHRFKSKSSAPDTIENLSAEVHGLSLAALFGLLTEFLKYYLRIYSDKGTIEHQLGKAILEQIEN